MKSLFNQNQAVYSLDTSAPIAGFNERYPIEHFPGFWRDIEKLIRSDRLKMTQVAFDEGMRDQGIKEWCDQNELKPYLLATIDDFIQNKVREVLKEFPKLLDDRRGKSGVDLIKREDWVYNAGAGR